MPSKKKSATASEETPKGETLQPHEDKTNVKEKKEGKEKAVVMGTAFTHPSAEVYGETGVEKVYGRRYATPEEACKGEHPTTNAPMFLGMAMLPKEASPSRMGFEKLGPSVECDPPKMNAAAEATNTTPSFREGTGTRAMRREGSARVHDTGKENRELRDEHIEKLKVEA